MPGVLTVTLAPSIDRSYRLDVLTPGALHPAEDWSEEFAGKGVNVSHALQLGTTPTLAIAPLPRSEWAQWAAPGWLPFVEASAKPRVSVSLVEESGRTTKITVTSR